MRTLVKVTEKIDNPDFNVKGRYYAIVDTCTYAGGPLSEGEIEGTVVTCPWHGAMFDIANGEELGEPFPKGVKSYKVHLEGEDIKVEV